jgi:hypothetical protein
MQIKKKSVRLDGGKELLHFSFLSQSTDFGMGMMSRKQTAVVAELDPSVDNW